MSTTTAPDPNMTVNAAPGRRPVVRSAVAVIVVALSLTGITYLVQGDPAPAAAPYEEFALSDAQAVLAPALPADRIVGIPLADEATTATIDRLVLQTTPTSSPGQLSLLARLLLQRAAVTGDAGTYGRAIASLDRAVALAPDDVAVRAQRASARITTHDFPGAARDAAVVLAANPDDVAGLGAAYDAAVETGHYARAEATLKSLGRLAPDSAPVLFRRARWAALHGERATAASLAARARASAVAAGAVGTSRATYDLIIGKLALDEGRYPVAVAAYEAAVQAAPGWHAALAGLGRARAASGDRVGAEAALAMAADAVPLPDTLSSLGDVRTALGDDAGAATAYGTVDVVGSIAAAQRTYTRAIVLSYADRGTRTAQAVRAARAELAIRRDVHGNDALAWALLADGRAREAVPYADAALALGTADPRLLAHAGLVHAAVGHRVRATDLLTAALDLSPAFDPLLAPRVRTTLDELAAGETS